MNETVLQILLEAGWPKMTWHVEPHPEHPFFVVTSGAAGKTASFLVPHHWFNGGSDIWPEACFRIGQVMKHVLSSTTGEKLIAVHLTNTSKGPYT